jgi:hypothetical protein
MTLTSAILDGTTPRKCQGTVSRYCPFGTDNTLRGLYAVRTSCTDNTPGGSYAARTSCGGLYVVRTSNTDNTLEGLYVLPVLTIRSGDSRSLCVRYHRTENGSV